MKKPGNEEETIPDSWSLRGLAWRDMAKRICRRSWDDEVFGQAARLAFYYFLSMFPVLLLLLVWLDKFAGTASTESNLRDALLGAFQQILPRGASELMAKTVGQLNAGAVIGAGAVYAALGSVWGALNGTWAMMSGLNKAYEVKEERRWWKVLRIALGLTTSLAIIGLIGLAAIPDGSLTWKAIGHHSGIGSHPPFLWRIIRWLMTAILLLFSFALVYRFGPNLKDRRWRWSVPGAVVAATLWVASTLLLRFYQNHFSSQRIYGGLNAVVEILLWLYFTGAAIFIGGEVNSEIEKIAAKGRRADDGGCEERRSGGEATPKG
jgi:membrane protein